MTQSAENGLRARIAEGLRGHSLDSMNQDSGHHCKCGSDSRFEQRDGDHPWTSIDEHRADMVLRILPPAVTRPVPNAENDARPEPVECCASGRCEVCTPGYEWGGGYVFPPV